MSINEGARIAPLIAANDSLVKAAGAAMLLPDNYARVQLLTEDGYRALVYSGYDSTYIVYGELATDFPLCADYADICANDVKREAIKRGLSVRPYFGVLYYTMNATDTKGRNKRHAINFAICEDGRVLFFEPQGSKWLDRPYDLKSYDEAIL